MCATQSDKIRACCYGWSHGKVFLLLENYLRTVLAFSLPEALNDARWILGTRAFARPTIATVSGMGK
jgi:hypothetical protein